MGQRAQRREGVVRDEATPDQIPERLEERLARIDLDPVNELRIERGTPCFEAVE